MTCDERIEKLLNMAGQTISDLPNAKQIQENAKFYDMIETADRMATDWIHPDDDEAYYNACALYLLHLTDIIDRLEWALDKTLREKAYLMVNCCSRCGALDTLMPVNFTYVHPTCEECDIEHVPDDWREDDAGLRSGTNWTIRRT